MRNNFHAKRSFRVNSVHLTAERLVTLKLRCLYNLLQVTLNKTAEKLSQVKASFVLTHFAQHASNINSFDDYDGQNNGHFCSPKIMTERGNCELTLPYWSRFWL